MLANFRELPAVSRSLTSQRITAMKEAGIGGVYALGNAGESTCQVPVGLGRVGMVLLGALDPVVAAVEAGIDIENIGESGIIEYGQLTHFEQLL